jgi:hypothetical protein
MPPAVESIRALGTIAISDARTPTTASKMKILREQQWRRREERPTSLVDAGAGAPPPRHAGQRRSPTRLQCCCLRGDRLAPGPASAPTLNEHRSEGLAVADAARAQVADDRVRKLCGRVGAG